MVKFFTMHRLTGSSRCKLSCVGGEIEVVLLTQERELDKRVVIAAPRGPVDPVGTFFFQPDQRDAP